MLSKLLRSGIQFPTTLMDDRIATLLEKAKALPKAPGVYLMKDHTGRVVYVGKAALLRDRVSSYFLASTKLEFKKSGLLDCVVDFDILETESEVEALLAENRLIKDIQPKYNVRLLDDKTFPYLMITTSDDYPGVFVTREPRTAGVKLYGPFTSVASLKDAVTLLQKAFKFRTCHLEISEDDPNRRFFRPCLLYPIKQCTAPCADRISKELYRKDIFRLIRFLDGDRNEVITQLQADMMEASAALDFERAARFRDQIKALTTLGQRAGKGDQTYWQPEAFVTNPREALAKLQEVLCLNEPPRIVEGIDIAHLQGGELVGSKVCFIDGVPFKAGYRRYKIRHGQGNNDYLSIQEVVSRRYHEAGQSNELYPDVILIDGGLGQLHAAMEVFKTMDVRPPMVIALAKKEELVYTQAKSEPLKLARNHTGLRMLQYVRDEAHRFAQHYHHLLRRKNVLEEEILMGRRPPRIRKKWPGTKIEDTLPKEPIAKEKRSDAEQNMADAESLDPEPRADFELPVQETTETAETAEAAEGPHDVDQS